MKKFEEIFNLMSMLIAIVLLLPVITLFLQPITFQTIENVFQSLISLIIPVLIFAIILEFFRRRLE